MAKCPWVMCTDQLPEFHEEVEVCTVDMTIYRAFLLPKSYKWVINSPNMTLYRDKVTDWKPLTLTPLPERFL